MLDIIVLIFGGRKAREEYRAHTEAIVRLTAAQRELRELLYG